MGHSTFKVCPPSSAKPPWKDRPAHLEVCLLGDSKSCQVDYQAGSKLSRKTWGEPAQKALPQTSK